MDTGRPENLKRGPVSWKPTPSNVPTQRTENTTTIDAMTPPAALSKETGNLIRKLRVGIECLTKDSVI